MSATLPLGSILSVELSVCKFIYILFISKEFVWSQLIFTICSNKEEIGTHTPADSLGIWGISLPLLDATVRACGLTMNSWNLLEVVAQWELQKNRLCSKKMFLI
jgi:hypothetical protein